MARFLRFFIRAVLPIVVLIGAGVLARDLIAGRAKPKPKPRVERHPFVKVVDVERTPHSLTIRGQGTVTAAHRMVLNPEATGRLKSVHPQLVAGGFIPAGERLFEIDPRTYDLNIKERKRAIDEAKASLSIEKGQQQVAKREWDLFKTQVDAAGGDSTDPSLVLREPQRKRAEAALASARVRLSRARLDKSRTRFDAPFNALVLNESVEVGQFVSTQSQLATLTDADVFWVQVSVPFSELRWIDVPKRNGVQSGACARISQDLGHGQRLERVGHVVQLLTELDQAGRTAQVLVAIEDPMSLGLPRSKESARCEARFPFPSSASPPSLSAAADPPALKPGVTLTSTVLTGAIGGAASGVSATAAPITAELPLLLGAYVNVELEGNHSEALFKIPREAIRDGDHVHVLTAKETLDIRPVEIFWRYPDHVMIRQGLVDGESVVVSPLSAPVHGMTLREVSDPAAPAAPDEAPPTPDAASEETGGRDE